ncbi:hypothetical protein ACFPU0_21445 [Pseudomonas sp. GCM10022186]|uniref:hypothetical protein n=1 Tax=Pseudomonas sp. GCM10022186 TaxID=3252650 RepID=UPI00361CB3AD
MQSINASPHPMQGFHKRNATTDFWTHPIQLELPFLDSGSPALNQLDSSLPTPGRPARNECRNRVE